jgi:tetratricopeptide (TPR) repeat protein
MLLQLLRLCIVSLIVAVPFALADEGQHHHHGSTEEIGKVDFPISCPKAAQADFERGVALMHSFWYEESDKTFGALAEKYPKCAMAHWGVAMSTWHQLWTPPSGAELDKGVAAARKAESLAAKASPRERDYIQAIATYYRAYANTPAKKRAEAYSAAMEQVYKKNPNDREAAVFYALSLITITDPNDKTFARQRTGGPILKKIFAEQPHHPGVAHYIIHNYDYAGLAEEGLDAARRYAAIAPAVPHALHMPSHIFTRVGMWQESIKSNSDSERAAIDYAKRTNMDGAWDQQVHAMDYLAYAYLQSGQHRAAAKVLDDLSKIKKVVPNTMVAEYAVAAIGARYAVERRDWKTAASLPLRQSARSAGLIGMIHLSRALGAAHTGDFAQADAEMAEMEKLHKQLAEANDSYWAGQVEIQRAAAAGWLAHEQGKNDEAERLLRQAADLEDRTDKLNVTPGVIVPARELLADFLMETNQAAPALKEYAKTLDAAPRRFNALYGAARAAQAAGESATARKYFAKLLESAPKADDGLAQIVEAKRYVGQEAAVAK